jgi:hypothetical protein
MNALYFILRDAALRSAPQDEDSEFDPHPEEAKRRLEG